MARDWDPESVFDVLGNEQVRKILALTSVKPMSVQDLAENLDSSRPTVYRRVNACQEYDLVAEDTQIDGDGNHYNVYEANLERITFELEEGGFNVDIELRHDLVDQFGDFWSDLEGDG